MQPLVRFDLFGAGVARVSTTMWNADLASAKGSDLRGVMNSYHTREQHGLTADIPDMLVGQ